MNFYKSEILSLLSILLFNMVADVKHGVFISQIGFRD